ncbi:cupin domain-containing protein [bacterium]|nr:cupin domain-containing protein [bacterium]
MLIHRWQAPNIPSPTQIKMMLESEGLEPFEEVLEKGKRIPDHRHPFDEVRMVASGELLLEILGTRMLLREGDKIIIPANTRHAKQASGEENCVCICAYQVD